jgi:hypothetical protein
MKEVLLVVFQARQGRKVRGVWGKMGLGGNVCNREEVELFSAI